MKFFADLYDKAGLLLTGKASVPGRPAAPTVPLAQRVDAPKTADPSAVRSGPETWPLDRTLLQFFQHDEKTQRTGWFSYSLADIYEGVLIMGANGSGKSSGSGQYLAHALLKAGFGGVILCAKEGEAATWEKYAQATGREADLVMFSEEKGSGFNFLAYEMARAKGNPADAAAAVLLELSGASGGDEKNKFWSDSARRLIRNCLDACRLGDETPTLAHVYRVATSKKAVKALLEKAKARADAGELAKGQVADLGVLWSYFGEEWPNLASDTKSGILAHMTTTCAPFLSGAMRDMFADHTTVSPDDVFAGKIVVVDLPTKTYYEAGKSAGVAWKYCMQRAAERRAVTDSDRPTFIWADEADNYVTAKDGDFVRSSRSARCAMILLTQNLPSLLIRLSKDQTSAMTGCFQTKIFHQNGESTTNEWASNTIAKDFVSRTSTSTGYQVGGKEGTSGSGGTSTQEHYEHVLQPGKFLGLTKGGAANHFAVSAYFFQSGREFPLSRTTYAKVVFVQNNVLLGPPQKQRKTK